jgi:hypothetical protein
MKQWKGGFEHLFGQARGGVGTAVIHHDDLGVIGVNCTRPRRAIQLLHAPHQARRFIEGGNDKAEPRGVPDKRFGTTHIEIRMCGLV